MSLSRLTKAQLIEELERSRARVQELERGLRAQGAGEQGDELEVRVAQRTEDLRSLYASLEEEVRQRRQVQQELARSEETYRSLIQNLSVGVYRSNLDGQILQANPALARMFGFDSVQQLMEHSMADRYRDPVERVAFLERLLNLGRVYNVELRLKRADGQPIHGACTATLKLDDQGAPQWIDGIIEDVTRRRRAEEALRQSVERFRSLGENAPEIIYTLNMEGMFTYVNPAWERVLGHAPDEVVGRYFVEFCLPEDVRFFRKVFRRIRDEKTTENNIKPLRHKDGGARVFSMSGAPNTDGQGRVTGMVGMFLDITERINAERALKASEERHRQVLEGAPDPIVIYDIDGCVTWVNAAFTQVFGWRLDELEGRRLNFVPPEAAELRDKLVAQVKAGQPCLDQETLRLTREGRKVHVSISASLYAGGPDSPGGVVVTLRDITLRKKAAEALAKSEASLARAQAMARLGNWEMDVRSGKFHCSDEVFRIYGVPNDGRLVSEERFYDSVHRDDRDMVRRAMRELPEGQNSVDIEHRIVRPGGQERIVHQLVEFERDPDGKLTKIVGAVQDITERKANEEQMRLLARVFENTVEGIVVTDAEAKIEMVNPAFTDITGYNEAEALGQNPRILNSGRHDKEFYRDMWSRLLEDGHWQGEIWNRRKNGEAYPEWLTITALRNNRGQVTHYVAVFHDITENKRSEEQIAYQAYHDALTGLPNRLLFNDRLAMAIAHAHRGRHGLAVMFLDLDNFKNINDSLGHAVGDMLLQSVARRLLNWVREEDTVARLGGDEFIMLLQGSDDPDYAVHVAQRIQTSLAEPFRVNGHELYVTASLGITMYPHDGKELETLVANADMAMYRAKEEGRNRYKLFTPAMNERVVKRLELESALRGAVDRGELVVHYQPKVDVATGRMTGLEALVRWQRPGVGLVPPAEFIPLAEETGLIVTIGEWVLRTACRRTRQWHEEGWDHLHVAVNLSPRQFLERNLVETVAGALEEAALAPRFLELEVTEGVVMHNVEEAIETLGQLADLGVQLSLDDFGRGYSSLYYLKRFPMNSLKIDRSFVSDVVSDSDDASIVNTIISMSRSLNLKVVAEGVETAEQLNFLRGQHCDQMQGFLYSRPLPEDELTKLLREGKLLPL